VELYLHSSNTPSYRGVQLKHRDNFTLSFTQKEGVGDHSAEENIWTSEGGSSRRLGKLHNVCSPRSTMRVIKSRQMKWVGYVGRTGEMRAAYEILVEDPQGTEALGRHRRRPEDSN
jgi:hypothetical protein